MPKASLDHWIGKAEMDEGTLETCGLLLQQQSVLFEHDAAPSLEHLSKNCQSVELNWTATSKELVFVLNALCIKLQHM